jgi:hypothetical protein
VFVDRKPLQSFRPRREPGRGRAWRCWWKRYDRDGKVVRSEASYIPGSKGLNYKAASAYFARLAGGERGQRPIGTRPLCHEAIQKTVQKVALRIGIAATPATFVTPLRPTFSTTVLTCGSCRFSWGTRASRALRFTRVSARRWSKGPLSAVTLVRPSGGDVAMRITERRGGRRIEVVPPWFLSREQIRQVAALLPPHYHKRFRA